MCQLKRIDGMWRLGTGKGRRRDVDEAPSENVENVEVIEEKNFNKILIGNKLRKMREIRGKNKLKKKSKFGGTKKEKGCDGIFKIMESTPRDIFRTMSDSSASR
ncbi:hypothetical protein Dimus_008665, partial [Dionaea muscipula]